MDNGAVLDLYAATRHTFCTLLALAEVAPHRQRLLMRHADIGTTMKYTHLQVIDLVEGIEALPEIASGAYIVSAEHMRNRDRVLAQECARGDDVEGESGHCDPATHTIDNLLKVQELASPDNAIQELAKSLSQKELWWRRRESNPRHGVFLSR